MWDAATGKERKAPGYTQAGSSAVAYSPDGRRFAAASRDGTIHVWDVTTEQELRQLPGHTDAVAALAWSPDGLILASASYDSTVRLWDAIQTQ